MTTVDYLRIASWDFTTYTNLVSKIRAHYVSEWTPRRWLQYKGQESEGAGIFYGAGDQGDKKHFVISSSGHKSAGFFNYLMDLGLDWEKIYCTRIDLQQTIRHPKGVKLRKVYKACPRGRKTWIESDTETMYVGARTSDVFTRLYQKLERRFLRLEHEFKGNRARAIWMHCLTTTNHLAVLQSHFVSATTRCKMGKWIQMYFDMERDILEMTIGGQVEELQDVVDKRMTYIVNTEKALSKYINDDDLRGPVTAMIERLHTYATSKT